MTKITNANWTFDPAHSSINFKVRHMMFAKVRGKFTDWDGKFYFDDENLAESQVSASIDVTSIDTGVADRDAHLLSADFFDADNHAHIDFRSTGFERLSENQFLVRGDLTIRGTTRPVELAVDYHGQGIDPWGNNRTGFTATTTLNRGDFGLTWNQAIEAGGVLVGDKVEVEIEVQATAKSE